MASISCTCGRIVIQRASRYASRSPCEQLSCVVVSLYIVQWRASRYIVQWRVWVFVARTVSRQPTIGLICLSRLGDQMEITARSGLLLLHPAVINASSDSG